MELYLHWRLCRTSFYISVSTDTPNFSIGLPSIDIHPRLVIENKRNGGIAARRHHEYRWGIVSRL